MIDPGRSLIRWHDFGITQGRNQREAEILEILETLHRREYRGPHDSRLCTACRAISRINGEAK